MERAVERGVSQYVILGAGLDSFAYRRTDLASVLRVFEVDHPATQAWKRRRLGEEGIDLPPNLNLVPVDFEKQSLLEGLRASDYRTNLPAVFSWLGVTMYLSEATAMSVLGAIANLPRGSGVVFDYAINPMELTEPVRKAVEFMASRVAAAGEPWTLFFDPARLARSLDALGYTHVDDLDGEAINARYFDGRADGLQVGSAGRLLYAEV